MPELRVEELDIGSAAQLNKLEGIERRSFRNPWTLAEFQLLVQDTRALNVGMWRGRDLVGYAIGFTEEKEFHLASLAVEPAWRGRGLATRLFESILEKARHRGCTACRLEVRPSNRAARALYERLGFETAGEIPRFYTDPEEAALRLRGRIGDIHRREIHSGAENP